MGEVRQLSIIPPLSNNPLGGRLKRNTVVCKLANVPFLSSLVKDPCNRYCQVAGHSGGSCQEDKCQCSAKPVSTYFCSEEHSEDAEERRKACATYCHFKGKQTGTCNENTGECECIEEELRAKHTVCIGPAEDNLCSIKCQTMEQAKSGYCGGEHGWDCICEYDEESNAIPEPKTN